VNDSNFLDCPKGRMRNVDGCEQREPYDTKAVG